MKKSLLFLLSILILVPYVLAQSPVHSSLLWEISGNGLKQNSYLFGTIHIQDKRVFDFREQVLVKFDACEAFALEVILDEVNPLAALRATFMDNDNTLEKLLGSDDYKLLNNVFKEKLGTPVGLFNNMKPFFVASQLLIASIKSDMPEPMDLHLLSKARKDKKKVIGIENFEEQIKAIDCVPLELQCKMLMDEVKDIDDSQNSLEYLIKAYRSENLVLIMELTEDTTENKIFDNIFLHDRNIVMAKRIAAQIKIQSTFNAVGAAHLGGDDGIIALLRKKGFTVKPVK